VSARLPCADKGAWAALLVLFAAACTRRPGDVRWRRALAQLREWRWHGTDAARSRLGQARG
jgi:hypothetical protein